MDLSVQKRLAAKTFGVGVDRVRISPEKVNEVKNALTREDIRILVHKGVIEILPIKGQSRKRARELHEKRKKGRRRGHGSRKGKKTARFPKKRQWILKVRAQRKLIKILREKGLIDGKVYRRVYRMIKAGVFRSRRHILLWLRDRKLIKEQ